MLTDMQKPVTRLINRVKMVSLMVAVLLWPAIALAESPAPAPILKKAPPIWLGLLVMVLLLAIVLAISLMPSKRGHQD